MITMPATLPIITMTFPVVASKISILTTSDTTSSSPVVFTVTTMRVPGIAIFEEITMVTSLTETAPPLPPLPTKVIDPSVLIIV
jgi:hypothetical protein